jgi:WD40 repeat protein
MTYNSGVSINTIFPGGLAYASGVSSVAFSPEGQYVASGACDQLDSGRSACTQSSVRVWKATTGKEVARMVHQGLVRTVAFSPDGKFLISTSDTIPVCGRQPPEKKLPAWRIKAL